MTKLPAHKTPWGEIRKELGSLKSEDHDWRSGKLPVYIYFHTQELLDVQCEAFSMYMIENGHGAKTVFPSLRRMEEDVIKISLDLFHAPQDAQGSLTSGGSESIGLAIKACREYALAKRPGGQLNIVGSRCMHPAFNKFAEMMGIEVRRTLPDAGGRAVVSALEASMDEDTFMLVGSAPAYPHGVFDPLSEIGALAQKHGVLYHVDACFGGYLSPFARDLGYPIPAFDFEIPGVTTMSADLHKYGFAAKGASVCLYRDPEIYALQAFEFDDWPRGLYKSTTFAGSKPGGAVAAAWAVMRHLGREGYQELAKATMTAKDALVAGVQEIEGLDVYAPGELSIFAYTSNDPRVDIDGVAELMGQRGWFVSRTAEPKGVHFSVNPVHERSVQPYLDDLRASVISARQTGKKGRFVESTY